MMLKGQFTRWNDTNSAQLRHLWNVEGLSSGDIAFIMGISRNAVIGRARRMDLLMRDNIKTPPRVKPRKQYEASAPRRRAPRHTTLKLLPVALPGDTRRLRGDAWSPIDGVAPVSLVDLEPGMCKWPVTEDKPFLFCGAKCHGPYCEEHHALSVGRGTPSERAAVDWRDAA